MFDGNKINIIFNTIKIFINKLLVLVWNITEYVIWTQMSFRQIIVISEEKKSVNFGFGLISAVCIYALN